jgi:hypothetical protein
MAEEAVMLDKPSKPYNCDHLRMLTSILNETLAAVTKTNGAPVGDVQERIGRVIMDSFIAGETDPGRLKAIALQSIEVQ